MTDYNNDNKTMLASLVSAQIAGLIMALAVMLVFTLLGKGPLFPVQVIGSTIFGESALQGFHFGALIAGLVLHQLGPSLLWGLLFALFANLFQVSNTRSSLILGLLVGIVSMLGPYFLIPFIMNSLHGVDFWNQNVPMFWDWTAHIIFGISFVLYPQIKSSLQQ